MDGKKAGTTAAKFFTPLKYESASEEQGNAQQLRTAVEKNQVNGHSERDRLILAHHNIAYAVARQFKGRGVPYDDLVSEAMYGLCLAADEYDASRGRFSTYAFWVCRRVLHDQLRSHRRSNGQSIGQQRQLPQLYRAMNELGDRLGRPATIEEIADQTGWPTRKVSELLHVSQRTIVDLDGAVSDEDSTALSEKIPDLRAISPENRMEILQQIRAVHDLRESVRATVLAMKWSDRVKEIFLRRYRLGETGVRLRSEAEVAAVVGVSESRVSQVLARCWWRLRRDASCAQVTHDWFKSLPTRVTLLADVFGSEAIEQVFGPRDAWETHGKPIERDDMPRRRERSTNHELTPNEANLKARLEAQESPSAALVAQVISLLPVLSDRSREVLAKRFGFSNGDLVIVKNSILAGQVKLKPQSVGTTLFNALRDMHRQGLPKRVTVRSLNVAIQAIQDEWKASGTSVAPAPPARTETVPAPATAVTRDLRTALRDYVASRRLEERILRLWLVGTDEHFGPIESGVIAVMLGIEKTAVDQIIQRFASTAEVECK